MLNSVLDRTTSGPAEQQRKWHHITAQYSGLACPSIAACPSTALAFTVTTTPASCCCCRCSYCCATTAARRSESLKSCTIPVTADANLRLCASKTKSSPTSPNSLQVYPNLPTGKRYSSSSHIARFINVISRAILSVFFLSLPPFPLAYRPLPFRRPQVVFFFSFFFLSKNVLHVSPGWAAVGPAVLRPLWVADLSRRQLRYYAWTRE